MSSSATETVQVEMPKMGISVSEGTIVEWRKAVGDEISADETIADVTTDKVDVEIPSPASGVVSSLLVEPGESVDVGTVIAEIAPAGADVASQPGDSSTDAVQAEATSSDEPAVDGPDRSTFVSPVVARMADKHGVDISEVDGTGIGGRVRKKDVLAFLDDAPASGNGEVKAAPVLHSDSPYRPDEPEPAEKAEPVEKAAEPTTEGEAASEGREVMSPMRSAIAKHMVESRRTAAHCTTIVEVDMSRVAARRAELKPVMAKRGVPLTYLSFVAKATVGALAQYPVLNSSVDGDAIVHHDDVNLGIAVALDAGLIVPVIAKAQRLSVEGLAAEIADVATRAREKKLTPDDVQGGTFTITNPGQFGAVLATPIINQPQVAILDLEAIVKRPVVITAEDGSDSIAIRPMTYLCMSWDHRALDGAVAAHFLGTIKRDLEAGGEL